MYMYIYIQTINIYVYLLTCAGDRNDFYIIILAGNDNEWKLDGLYEYI